MSEFGRGRNANDSPSTPTTVKERLSSVTDLPITAASAPKRSCQIRWLRMAESAPLPPKSSGVKYRPADMYAPRIGRNSSLTNAPRCCSGPLEPAMRNGQSRSAANCANERLVLFHSSNARLETGLTRSGSSSFTLQAITKRSGSGYGRGLHRIESKRLTPTQQTAEPTSKVTMVAAERRGCCRSDLILPTRSAIIVVRVARQQRHAKAAVVQPFPESHLEVVTLWPYSGRCRPNCFFKWQGRPEARAWMRRSRVSDWAHSRSLASARPVRPLHVFRKSDVRANQA